MWPNKETTKRMLEATEIDFLGRVMGRSWFNGVTNEQIREIMPVTYTIMDEINRQLIWYGHMQRIIETRIPKQVINGKPFWGRKTGRPRRRSWQEGMDKIIQGRNLGDYMRRDRQEWRTGIGKRVKLWTNYIIIIRKYQIPWGSVDSTCEIVDSTYTIFTPHYQ